MEKLLSFDVFDTLLTRVVGQPGASFLLLGHRLAKRALIRCSPEAFARARAEAEQRAFANSGGLDSRVNLGHIYQEVANGLGLDEAQAHVLMEAELTLEAEILRPIPRVVDKLARAREAGTHIAYTSDMYLSSGTILEFLRSNGIANPEDVCYVSNEHARSKESGKLFELLLKNQRVSAKQVCHIGNNYRADVKAALSAGIKAEFFSEGNLNRFEETLSSFDFATQGLSAVLAGASRLARLEISAANTHERILRDVSAGVAAPLIVGFTLWVLHQAQRRKLRRLYFVSRDGQIILEVARRLAPKLGLEFDMRYLYGSRQAWSLATITSLGQGQLDNIFNSYDFKVLDHLSVRGALERVNCTPEELAQELTTLRLREKDWDRNLSLEERLQLRDLLLHNQNVHGLILSRASDARALMLAYLRQEGMFDDEAYGLVDLGTGGTLHRALEKVLSEVELRPLNSFYLGYTGNPKDVLGTLKPYFFDLHSSMGFLETTGLIQLVETVCSADHGTVLGYKRDGHDVTPILKSSGNDEVLTWGYRVVRETICKVADSLVLDEELLSPSSDLRPAIAAVIHSFWMKPTRAEAEVWGSFPFEDGWGKATYFLRLAQSYKWRDLPRIVRTRQLAPHRQSWQRGSLALTPFVLRKLLYALLRLQSMMALKLLQRSKHHLRYISRRFLRA